MQLTGPLNLPAPGRRQSVYIVLRLRTDCVFSKQSLLSGLCDPTQLRVQDSSPDKVPLLPKLRGHFAEFLNHSYLDRLSILYLTTCVGLGYGPCESSLEAFLGSIGSLNSPQRLRITSQASQVADLPTTRPTGLHRLLHQPAQLPSCVTPSLDYYHRRSHASTTPSPEGNRPASGQLVPVIHHGRVHTGTGISTVVHRLRLSASP